jgi:hypothetical protein
MMKPFCSVFLRCLGCQRLLRSGPLRQWKLKSRALCLFRLVCPSRKRHVVAAALEEVLWKMLRRRGFVKFSTIISKNWMAMIGPGAPCCVSVRRCLQVLARDLSVRWLGERFGLESVKIDTFRLTKRRIVSEFIPPDFILGDRDVEHLISFSVIYWTAMYAERRFVTEIYL